MKETKNRALRDIVVVGFALFSMFFGAGNVIFPPYLGMESGPQWLAGFSAYFIADIGLALAAMFALLRVGSSEAVLQRVGRVPSEVLMCAIILCVGPMVAIPRTSASTFEMAIAPNLPGVSAVVFSVLFFALILALCIRESAVVDIVGKVLTPLLLVGLAAIIIKGVVTPLGTIAPEAKVLLFFFIPIKMKYMAWVYLGFTVLNVFSSLQLASFLSFYWLLPVVPLLNYFLFFGSDVKNILPDTLRYRQRKNYRTTTTNARPNPNWAGSYRSKSGEKPYRHKCTVCGRTDTDYPNLEFRYCSKCNGYYCYCIDHINNHVHITTPPEGAEKEK